jgi:RimJ/RimL family protein N-acetyltransferase
MEKMPYNANDESTISVALSAPTTSSDWQQKLPVLTGRTITLRELELTDAPSLLAMLTTEEVSRFISPPPTTVEGFERFITWTHKQRTAGQYVCFAVVPEGMTNAIGLFQVRSLEAGFGTAEWGFALGSQYWGTGIFVEGAQLVVDFAFEAIGVRRLEARSSARNGRGNGALRKLGAVQEGVLRQSFLKDGEYHDQVLWSIIDTEWAQAKPLRQALASLVAKPRSGATVLKFRPRRSANARVSQAVMTPSGREAVSAVIPKRAAVVNHRID